MTVDGPFSCCLAANVSDSRAVCNYLTTAALSTAGNSPQGDATPGADGDHWSKTSVAKILADSSRVSGYPAAVGVVGPTVVMGGGGMSQGWHGSVG